MEPRLRLATPDDAAAIRSIYAPYVESTPVSFEAEPPTVAELADRIERTLEKYPWIVCEAGGESDDAAGDEADSEVVGYAAGSSLRSMAAYEWSVELSVYVADDAQRSGVGTALYESLLAVLERQGYYSTYAAMTLPNPASTRLHERLGFEPVGTFPAAGYTAGEWRDVKWWYRPLAEHPADPEPPTPLPDLPDETVHDALATGEERLER